MTKTFTASTGVNVRRYGLKTDRGYALLVDGARIGPNDVQALREYLRDERDRELGRWRWPENPDYVVYPCEVVGFEDSDYQECVVLQESTGSRISFGSDLPQCHGGSFREAARAYFAAHPEKKPHPWEDSPAGSVWKIVSAGRERHALIWRSNVGDWDVLGPKGESIKEADDPVAALVEAGYPEFEEYKSAVEMKES